MPRNILVGGLVLVALTLCLVLVFNKLGNPVAWAQGQTTPSPSQQPNPRPSPQPSPQPSPPPTPPPAPQPSPLPPDSGELFKAGGPNDGPMPLMKGGSCPQEFPDRRGNACYAVR